MSTYVISDIHGCYNTFLSLLEQINFSDENDVLYILGDIIDRGDKSFEMYEWVKNRINKNVFMILGNHEDMFCENVLMYHGKVIDEKRKELLKEGIVYHMSKEEEENCSNYKLFGFSEAYGTIDHLVNTLNKDIYTLLEMKDFFRSLPYFYEIEVNNKTYTLVHAYCESNITRTGSFDFIWNRSLVEDVYVENRNVIFGHTPTISGEYGYKGKIIIEVKDENTSKINLDCGCVWQKQNSLLGILRLDDMKAAYAKNIDKRIS